MAEEPTSTLTKKYVSTANIAVGKPTKVTLTASTYQSKLVARFSHFLVAASTVGAAFMTAVGSGWVNLSESQTLSAFFQLRGAIAPPADIVILAIDDQSISVPAQYHNSDPKQYAYLEPLKSFPFKRAAYSQIIEKLVKAGARSVAIDILFDTPSSYGSTDDSQFQAALKKYGSKVTLAALYENFASHQGAFMQLTLPQEMFQVGSVAYGVVNYPLEADGKIHKLSSEFSKLLTTENDLQEKVASFDEAVLASAKIKYPPPKGDRIHFWGPAGTFTQIPLWYVLDSQNWNNYLQQGRVFQNKIVLIGSTEKLHNDYHPVAGAGISERMSGVEIHANAIATLMENKAIAPAISRPAWQGLFVFVLVGATVCIVTRTKNNLKRFLASIFCASIWGSVSYISFVHGQLIFPTAIPMIAIVVNGLTFLGAEIARDKMRTRQLVTIFQKYKTSPVVQEIISQQNDLQDLLQQRDIALSGKILAGRYKIVKVLGSGGFSETYVAEDMQRPGYPRCVVKQLKPANTQAKSLQLARRLFHSEAETLEKLGIYNQIPQLLAYFEQDDEFYLVQEYIVGHSLAKELPLGQGIPETAVINIIRELLQILVFVHENGVIHRDIKPSNIIRRHSDKKLVLIDFGAVKELSTPQEENSEQSPFTIGIGTKGYAPSEQCFGRPQYSSDIYAIGMIGIRALTGIAPHEIDRNEDGEWEWKDQAFVSKALADILSKMVLDDFKQRYQSASEVLIALDNLAIPHTTYLQLTDVPTTPWPDSSADTL